MASDLNREQFISLFTVGDATPESPPAIIPKEHETRLVALGYIVYLQGRLRMTTRGRRRIVDSG